MTCVTAASRPNGWRFFFDLIGSLRYNRYHIVGRAMGKNLLNAFALRFRNVENRLAGVTVAIGVKLLSFRDQTAGVNVTPPTVNEAV